MTTDRTESCPYMLVSSLLYPRPPHPTQQGALATRPYELDSRISDPLVMAESTREGSTVLTLPGPPLGGTQVVQDLGTWTHAVSWMEHKAGRIDDQQGL